MRIKRKVSVLVSLLSLIAISGIIIITENQILNFIFKIPKQNVITNQIDSKASMVAERELQIENNFMIKPKYANVCYVDLINSPKVDIQMLNLYEKLKFENVDGGPWRQGWEIEINNDRWNENRKLRVFIVPHSHNDPGWIKTFDEYFVEKTWKILNNVLQKLTEDPRRKFIWAEISFFSMWWNNLSREKKEQVKRILKTNQLEIVTGGWVMNDEANSHWISTVHQLSEGHQWLHKNLNYTPRSHWSIDPFGLSSTQALILKKSGFENMLIQRVHYEVKKRLALQKNLEFKWIQTWDVFGLSLSYGQKKLLFIFSWPWSKLDDFFQTFLHLFWMSSSVASNRGLRTLIDSNGDSGIFTQLMPFYSYDIPHTCGPDPMVCCQFDFKRFPQFRLSCPWKVPPKLITGENVAKRAELLLDQYRKKAMLFKTNAVLIPLGDDFRYDDPLECDHQYDNYEKLMDYMNSKEDLNVEIQFGTLSDYFDAVHRDTPDDKFPSLSGDFFTYCDVDDHYWSGYYTSRPFYKRMDRILLHYLRSTEIILTLAKLRTKFDFEWEIFESKISKSRGALALFQHHDGITGTSKTYVVEDYGKRLYTSINDLQSVISDMTYILLSNNYIKEHIFYKIDEIWSDQKTLPKNQEIILDESETQYVVIYNSLPIERQEVITFIVSTPFVEVLDKEGNTVKCQISPIFYEEGTKLKVSTSYELSFVVDIKALDLKSYSIQAVGQHEISRDTYYSSIEIYNQQVIEEMQNLPSVFDSVKTVTDDVDFILENDYLTAMFSPKGLLTAIVIDSIVNPIDLTFVKYGVRRDPLKSGAYLFLPDGEATTLDLFKDSVKKVTKGPIVSKVDIKSTYVHQIVRIFNHYVESIGNIIVFLEGVKNFGIEIENNVDIRTTENFELAMRLTTNIQNNDEFFTDLNDYQILRRKRFDKLPLQANFYPMPSMVYIEDSTTRLTVVSGTPLGCSSLKEGQVEIMQDRKLMQDDNLGLFQAMNDNIPTRHVFRLLVEPKNSECFTTSDDHPNGFPSVAAHISSQSLLNPLIKLINIEKGDSSEIHNSYEPPNIDFGVGYTLPILRTGIQINENEYIGVTLHRRHLDFCYTDDDYGTKNLKINLKNILSPNKNGTLIKSSLTYMHTYEKLDINEYIDICPMEVATFLFDNPS